MIDDLYQEVIIDHSRSPRNQGRLPLATHRAEGHNPLCGDCVTVHLRVENDRVADAAFEGSGCAISIASASLMTEAVVGKTTAEAKALMEAFRSMLVDQACARCELGALEALRGVKNYPMRVKCATLAWHTLGAAIDGKEVAQDA